MARADTPAALSPSAADHLTIALIATAHFAAHFYILVLPPLFPTLARDLGLSYAELGLALALLNGTTALFQAPIGFLVDRFGPFAILLLGQSLFSAAIAAIGWFADPRVLFLGCALAGLGNAVYHPADYAILGSRVSRARMGRAFSIHTFGGYLGFAAAPATVVGLAEWIGWQNALLGVGLAGFAISAALLLCRDLLAVPQAAAPVGSGATGSSLALLMSRPMLLAFAFFTLYALAQGGINSFTPTVLDAVYGFGLVAANLPLAAFLAASTLGVLLGGIVADRTERHDAVVAVCFLVMAAFAGSVAVLPLPQPLLVGSFALAGMAAGAIAPSRDMLVRAITPEGQSGKVFGFVTTGFNLAGMLAPPLFGLVVDAGAPRLVFVLVALLALVNLPLVFAAGGRDRAG
ncbi:putative L-galactonate transporter [bacterium HR40]|nr:putative L-galactonate transporter [bacterium HR40]